MVEEKAQVSLETIVIIGAVLLVLAISALYVAGYLGEGEPECRVNDDCLVDFEGCSNNSDSCIIECLNETCIETSQTCGNGIIELDEVCEPTNITSNCSAEKGAMYTGTLGCSDDCLSFDLSDCSMMIICGDGYCNGDENCSTCAVDCGACPFCGDGTCNINENCSNCSDDCGVCSVCNNGIIEIGELCDGLNITSNCSEELMGDYIGNLTCSDDCLSYNTSACISTSDPDILEFACNDSVDLTLGDLGISFNSSLFDSAFNFGTPNCCGDDENEWYLQDIHDYLSSDSGSTPGGEPGYGDGSFNSFACCNEQTDCVGLDGNCYDDSVVHPVNLAAFCVLGEWKDCIDDTIGNAFGDYCCTKTSGDDNSWSAFPLAEDDYSCSDGFDNDCDGSIDCNDLDCAEEVNCLIRPLSLVGSYNTLGFSQDVFVRNNFAFVADRTNGLVVIDVSNKAIPSKTGKYSASGGDYYGVHVKGETAFVADWVNGLIVVDVTSKSIPILKGSYDTAGNPLDVFVQNNYAFVADSSNGLVILDVSNEDNPVKVGYYNTLGLAQGIFIDGETAFVADGNNGLVIINVSDETNPIFISNYNTEGSAKDVYVEGDTAFIADGSKGFLILDISNKNVPTKEWNYDTSGDSKAVYVDNGFAFLSDNDKGMSVFYVGNKLKYQKTTSGLSYSVGVFAKESYIYSAGESFGLQIAELG